MLSSIAPTEDPILSLDSTPVVLGGKEYELKPKRGRARTRKFRKYIGPLVEDVRGLGSLLEKQFDGKDFKLVTSDWETVVELAKRFLGSDMDSLLDIVYDWEPSIAKDRGFLEGTHYQDGTEIPEHDQGESGATDSEFIQALFIIIKFIYGPFVERFLTIQNLAKAEEMK